MAKLTRREVIAAAAAIAVEPLVATAQADDAQLRDDRELLSGTDFEPFRKFIEISAGLTGIATSLLAPDSNVKGENDLGEPPDGEHAEKRPSGADPIERHKTTFFRLASAHPSYERLLGDFGDRKKEQFAAGARRGEALSNAAAKLMETSTEPVRELAQSIIMAWYFGVWYEWKGAEGGKPRFTVISADAYTQGWAWRIAQAHPAGYSNLRFGHWALRPPPAFDIPALLTNRDRA